MKTDLIFLNDPQDKTPVDNWISQHISASIKFVVSVASYSILIFYTEGE